VKCRQSIAVDSVRYISRTASARKQQIHDGVVAASGSGSMQGTPEECGVKMV
jgi:hypothetical protein